MKKIALFYISSHHKNTQKLVSSDQSIDIFQLNQIDSVNLQSYDLIGFASGIYMGKFHPTIVKAIQSHSNQLNDIFLVYTSGSGSPSYGKKFAKTLQKTTQLNVIDIFSCKGFDTYGPWKLIGAIAKNHPNQNDINKYKSFISKL